jgi:hypothetical protein
MAQGCAVLRVIRRARESAKKKTCRMPSFSKNLFLFCTDRGKMNERNYILIYFAALILNLWRLG